MRTNGPFKCPKKHLFAHKGRYISKKTDYRVKHKNAKKTID